jgi:hypothetical protein
LATNTIQLFQQIDNIAVKIAMHATDLERTIQAYNSLASVKKNAVDAPFLSSIEPFLIKSKNKADALTHNFDNMLSQLTYLVEQTRLQIRSAEVISTMSKIEASKSGAFEEQLKVIAVNIFEAASDIRKELESAEHLLAQT